MTGTMFDFSSLTPAERMMLVEALCDSLTQNGTVGDLSNEQLAEVHRRVAEVRTGRAEFVSLETLDAEISQPR